MPDADALLALAGDALPSHLPHTSFKPCASNVGFTTAAGRMGLHTAWLHYNRRSIPLGGDEAPFLPLPGACTRQRCSPILLDQQGGAMRLRLCAWRDDAWLIELSGAGPFVWHPARHLIDAREHDALTTVGWQGFAATRDPRDPDARVPVAIQLRLLAGRGERRDEGMLLMPGDDGRIVLALSVRVLEVDFREDLAPRVCETPGDFDAGLSQAHAWWRGTLGGLRLADEAAPEDARLIARACAVLLGNLVRGPGLLAGRTALFPNRGGYATHYLWDSAFHCLALRRFAPGLAEDSIRLITANQRPDGKQAHFLCSTWMRPHESQPPLMGWAALGVVRHRLAQGQGEAALAFAREVLPALRRNTQWWLTQRMTPRGLVRCPHPLETGWDDTPRLDQGPVLAVDMNAWVIMQINACAELAGLLGEARAAQVDRYRAAELGATLDAICYDYHHEIHLDAFAEKPGLVQAPSPASFLPLLAGVLDRDHDRSRAESIIRRWLLDPARFFGEQPFPSIAYDHPAYIPRPEQRSDGTGHACWRGPVWPNIAWMMVEVLEKFGFATAADQAADRLWRMLRDDGQLCEYFDSRTGEGLGTVEQGWTAAVAIALAGRRGLLT